MSFKRYTTQELEFIISNFDDLKRELEKRNEKESYNFPFEIGDVIYMKFNTYHSLFKIEKIEKRNKIIFVDEIIIRNDGSFDFYVDEWISINEVYNYVKIEDYEIFENLLNIIDKYNNDLQQLNDDTYLKLKNEIAPYECY